MLEFEVFHSLAHGLLNDLHEKVDIPLKAFKKSGRSREGESRTVARV